MHKIKNLGFIGVINNRSRAYLQRLCLKGLFPSYGFIMKKTSSIPIEGQTAIDVVDNKKNIPMMKPIIKNDDFVIDENETLQATFDKAEVPHEILDEVDMNAVNVIKALSSRPEKYWIFSGAGGNILKKEVLSIDKKYIHMHPGRVPDYRGSTTFLYSLIREGTACVSAILLSRGLDLGDLIATKTFSAPIDIKRIDYHYDPVIRSSILVDVISILEENGEFVTQKQPVEGTTYYTIHPILKHIALLSIKK